MLVRGQGVDLGDERLALRGMGGLREAVARFRAASRFDRPGTFRASSDEIERFLDGIEEG